MILRRLATSIRKQDWFTVVIETLIVVFGVYLGIQLGNWNGARQEQERAARYAERLSSDLQVEYESWLSLVDYMQTTHDAGNQAYLGLTEQVEMSDLDILITAFRASQCNWYERRRSTFDELVSAGATGLIEDDVLRVAAFNIYSTPLMDIMREEGGSADYRRLFRQTIEPAVAEELRLKCGDREVDSGRPQVNLLTISYPCSPDLDEAAMARGVEALRSREGILDALRLRTAERSGRIVDMIVTMESSGLNALFAGEDSP